MNFVGRLLSKLGIKHCHDSPEFSTTYTKIRKKNLYDTIAEELDSETVASPECMKFHQDYMRPSFWIMKDNCNMDEKSPEEIDDELCRIREEGDILYQARSPMNRPTFINFMQLFQDDIPEKTRRRLGEHNFNSLSNRILIGVINGICSGTLGVKFTPIKRQSDIYVLSHVHHFYHPKYPPLEEKDLPPGYVSSNKVPSEMWPHFVNPSELS
jgi:hypothetical protein